MIGCNIFFGVDVVTFVTAVGDLFGGYFLICQFIIRDQCSKGYCDLTWPVFDIKSADLFLSKQPSHSLKRVLARARAREVVCEIDGGVRISGQLCGEPQ